MLRRCLAPLSIALALTAVCRAQEFTLRVEQIEATASNEKQQSPSSERLESFIELNIELGERFRARSGSENHSVLCRGILSRDQDAEGRQLLTIRYVVMRQLGPMRPPSQTCVQTTIGIKMNEPCEFASLQTQDKPGEISYSNFRVLLTEPKTEQAD